MQGSFLYFYPGVEKEQITREFLASKPEAVAFFDLLHSPRLFSLHVQVAPIINRGPGGHSGCIVSPQPVIDNPAQKFGYYPEVQTWEEHDGRWIGYQTDMKPGPQSLKRINQIAGYETELADGNIWIAPTIRPYTPEDGSWGCNLPVSVGVDQAGEHTARIAERFRAAWELSGEVADTLYSNHPRSLFTMFDHATAVISVNYRIGATEASLLNLFDSDTITETLKAAVDYPLVSEYLHAEKHDLPS